MNLSVVSSNVFANTIFTQTRKKCEFDKSSVEYLGYILSADGIKMNPKKLDTILSWPFTSLSKGYSIIPRVHQLLPPFYFALRSHGATAPFAHSQECTTTVLSHRRSTCRIRKAALRFLSAPVLCHFNPSLPITLITDASDFALSGILHQPDEQGLLHPVAFYSRKFAPAEINYEIYDKELLAIVDSLRNFRSWTIGTAIPLSVICDHKNLF